MTSPLFGVALINGIVFGTYGPALRFFQNHYQQQTDEPCLHQSQYFKVAAAGSVAGFVQSFVCSPVELAKTKLQVQQKTYDGKKCLQHNRSSLYNGPVDVLRRLIKHDGIRGFYRGLWSTVLRDVPAFAIYFSSYSYLCNSLAQKGQSEYDLAAWKVILAGGTAGCLSWIVNIPIDVVKSRIQADSIAEPKYRGFMDCMLKIYRNEGPRALFRGLVPILLRAFPTNGTTFVVYSFSLQYMSNLLENDYN